MQRGNLLRLFRRHRADGGGAAQGIVENRTAARIEQSRVELVAAQQRHQRPVDPRRERRRGEERQIAAECHDVRDRTHVEGQASPVPGAVDRVRRVLLERPAEVRAAQLGARGAAIEVDDVDRDPLGGQAAHDAVARLRHPAAVGRVVLRDEEEPVHYWSLSLAKTRDQPSHRATCASWREACGVTVDPSSSRGIN